MTRAGEPARGRRDERRATRPFLFNVGSLRSRPGTRQEVHVASQVAELRALDAWVPEEAEVHFDGFLESTRGGVTVGGTVRAPYEGLCRRCLERATGEIVAEVREICREPGSEEDGGEDEPYPLGRDELDIEPIVRDACILELPLAPLCSENCLGLCPTCGANRNLGECSCPEPVDDRLSGLSVLSPPDDRHEAVRSDEDTG